MTKAERLFNETLIESMQTIKAFGLQRNPDGKAIGYNSFGETYCARTLNAIQKCLNSELRVMEIAKKYNHKYHNQLRLEAIEMVQSTIDNCWKVLEEL